MGYIKRNCDCCGVSYMADERNTKRGWGLTCSKSCAASKREKSKVGYNAERVERNNIRRVLWNESSSISCQKRVRRTSEGYEIRDGVAYNEFGEKMYNV